MKRYFVCVENGGVVSLLDYVPNVPETIEVVEIPEHQYQALLSGFYYFDCQRKEIQPILQEQLQSSTEYQAKISFLESTDWKILRHLREKALGIQTSLSEQQYIDLEIERQEIAKSIVR